MSGSSAPWMTWWCTASVSAKRISCSRSIMGRMDEVGLALHPEKTRIVYCQDGKRRGSYEHTAFTVPGYTFRCARGRSRREDV